MRHPLVVSGNRSANRRCLLSYRPVVPRVGDEQDDSPNAKVTLLAADSALQRLKIVDPRFSFDHHVNIRSFDNAIRASSITLDREWRPRFAT